jgi:hypothetical protein
MKLGSAHRRAYDARGNHCLSGKSAFKVNAR